MRARRRHKLARLSQGEGRGHIYREWRALLEACKHSCVMCGRTSEFVELTRDHVMPLVMGGDDCIWNLQPLCKPCNGFKAGNWVKDFRSPEQMAVLETLLKVRRIAK